MTLQKSDLVETTEAECKEQEIQCYYAEVVPGQEVYVGDQTAQQDINEEEYCEPDEPEPCDVDTTYENSCDNTCDCDENDTVMATC